MALTENDEWRRWIAENLPPGGARSGHGSDGQGGALKIVQIDCGRHAAS